VRIKTLLEKEISKKEAAPYILGKEAID